MGAVARPALGTRCPGTWRKPSGAGEVEVAPEEMECPDPAERAVIRIAGNAQELGLSAHQLTRWLSPLLCVLRGASGVGEEARGGLQGGAGLSCPE